MSPAQRTWLMAKTCKRYPLGGLWYQACAGATARAQGWNYNDRALRLATLSEAVGRPLASANDLNQVGDFDKVIQHLGTLAGDVARAAESDYAGEARRTLKDVRELLAELEELHPQPGQYVRTILQGIHRGRRVEFGGIEDLGIEPRFECQQCKAQAGRNPTRFCPGFGNEHVSELEQFRRTLTARLRGKNGLKKQLSAKTPSPAGEAVPF